MDLFELLSKTSSFKFSSSSQGISKTGWNGQAEGTVQIRKEKNTIFFKEDGILKLNGSPASIKTSNEYVWQKLDQNRIRLSHARFGHKNLVTLFDLAIKKDNLWESEAAHVCINDLYTAKCYQFSNKIKLTWKILGPQKNETIEYQYE